MRFTITIQDGQRAEGAVPQVIEADGFILLYNDNGQPQYLGQGKVPTPDTSMLQLGVIQLMGKLGNRGGGK